jgi:tetratricopeptide (TPR) repeat protein
VAEDRKASDDPAFAGPAAAAAAMALGAAGREQADTFLERQTALTDLQIENVRDQDRFEISHLRWRQFSDRMRGLLQVLIALLIGGVLAGATALVWNAAHDRDLVVDAFTVPPQIAQTGLNGTALANRVLDRYAEIENNSEGTLGASVAFRRAANEVHLEIPETGVSLGEINRTLRAWLGHDIHVSGELVRTATGLALTVRYGDKPGKTFTGDADAIDDLAKKAGDHMFASAQPYRYAEYLVDSQRFDEAKKFIPPLAHKGVPRDRARANVAWGLLYLRQGNVQRAIVKLHEALRLDPKSPVAHGWLANAEGFLGHEEKDRANAEALLRAMSSGTGRKDFDPIHLRIGPPIFTVNKGFDTGNLSGVIAALRRLADLGYGRPSAMAQAEAEDHDLIAARRTLAALPARNERGKPSLDTAWARMEVAQYERNWNGAVQWAEKAIEAAKSQGLWRTFAPTVAWPLEAYARARMGDIAGAEALIARTPRDCDACMRRRGQIAALAGNLAEARKDFAIVAARSPHEPFAETDWGAILLHRGRYEDAIAQFKIAHKKGPHFADPLEMWGEALIAKNRSDLALAKFKEADKEAPNWGRLHLKWGEALLWSGDKQGARKQFAVAAKLELTPEEKSQLAKVRHG